MTPNHCMQSKSTPQASHQICIRKYVARLVRGCASLVQSLIDESCIEVVGTKVSYELPSDA